MASLKVGVIIGRFQVPALHQGHWKLLKEVQDASDRMVILLGVSSLDGRTAENPLTFTQRQTMIQGSVPPGWKSLVMLPLFDQPSNNDWSAQIDGLLERAYAGHDITLFGGRDSFAQSYSGKFSVKHIRHAPAVSGTANRAAIKEGDNHDFYAGQIFALQQQYPHAYLTVDVALVRQPIPQGAYDVLLIQRVDSGQWCFPGGFVDPSDRTIELAGQRELQEEVGLMSEDSLHYIGSFLVDDFRYRGSRDKIMTTFFLGHHMAGIPVVNPTEVQDYKWVPICSLLPEITPIHQPLAQALQRFL